MMTSRLAPPLLWKEARALFPVWCACMLAVGAAATVHAGPIQGIGLIAYTVGSVALGAQAIGEEYAWRTLPVLLSLPAARHRLFLAKLGVLAVMLGAIALVAPAQWREPGRGSLPILVLAPLYAFCVAPWLTMTCRGALPGTVFTLVLPPMAFVGGQIMGSAMYGPESAAEIDRFTQTFLWRGSILLCATCAALGWSRFLRLEAIEGRGSDVSLPVWLRRGRAGGALRLRRRPPLWLLAAKELRLQQMTFVLGGLYITAWTMLTAMKHLRPDLNMPPLGTSATVCICLLSLLIGSVASAEERQFGTIEWQALLPMAAWRQWLVKVAVVLGLALAAVAVSIALARIDPSLGGVPSSRALLRLCVAVMLLASLSLYVSSLATSGVRAVALALALTFAGTLLVPMLGRLAWWILHGLLVPAWPPYARLSFMYPLRSGASAHVLLASAGLVAVLLWFAFTNHRSAERGAVRVGRQAAWLLGYLAAALLLNGLAIIATS